MSPENGAVDKSVRILIIEDTDTDYLLLERRLNKILPVMQCARATDRREVVEMLQHPWDLIISDYHLSDIEGENLLQLIAASHYDTPCLLLSGSIESVTTLDTPAHVYARLQKGDNDALSAAVLAIVRPH